jgi:tellurite resistance protein TerC
VELSLLRYFIPFLLALIVLDLGLFKLLSKKDGRRVALIETAFWIVIALAFNIWVWWYSGRSDLAFEFLTAYVVEKSLSVDNLFVILLIFESLKIPPSYQHRVLFFGVLGAIVMRAIFILVGAYLVQKFEWILLIFGAVLVFTAWKFIRENKTADVREEEQKLLRWLKKVIPLSSQVHGERFFIREGGRWLATPLFLALVFVELTDVIFAVDSIPAVFAVTKDGFIAFTSNIFAVLGLRALYFVLADFAKRLRYLKPGLAVILFFIGVKLLIIQWYHIPSWVSLMVISGVLSTAALSSWYVDRLQQKSLDQTR